MYLCLADPKSHPLHPKQSTRASQIHSRHLFPFPLLPLSHSLPLQLHGEGRVLGHLERVLMDLLHCAGPQSERAQAGTQLQGAAALPPASLLPGIVKVNHSSSLLLHSMSGSHQWLSGGNERVSRRDASIS